MNGNRRPAAVPKLLPSLPKDPALPLREDAASRLRRLLRGREEQIAALKSRLQGERMRFSLILGSLTVGVVLTDRNGRISLVNESARRMLGIAVNGPLRRPRHGSPLGDLLRRMRHPSLQGMKVAQLGIRGGGKVELRALVAPLRDESGSLWGTLGILEEGNDGSRLNELKSDFISRVSHELKTPLASIRAASDVIGQARIGVLNRKQEKMLGIITQETGNLVCLIEDLLDMSEIESGKIELHFKRCSLAEIARASLDTCRSRYQEKGVALLDSLAKACPPVQGDPARIRQVFDNLLSNALKFTPPGGRVELKVTPADGEGKAGARRMLQVSVSDNGIGIARDDLERIFDKFHQAENLNTRSAGGSGLGLSISRFMVEAHGGELWVDSRPGAGSTFFFTLPASR